MSSTNQNLIISRSVYTGTASTVGAVLPNGVASVANGTYPNVFQNANADGSFGVTSPIYLDTVTSSGTLIKTENLTQTVLSQTGKTLDTSFSSKSELALNLTPNGTGVTLIDYLAPANILDASNSNTPGHVDPTNPVPSTEEVQRAIVQLDSNGNVVKITPTNAYGGNNGRAVVLGNNGLYYTVGNADNGGSITIPGATTTLGSKTVTATNVYGLVAGQTITGNNIPTTSPVTIVAVDPATNSFVISSAATATGVDSKAKVIQTASILDNLSSDTGVQAIAPGDSTGNTTVVGAEQGSPTSTTGNQYGFSVASLGDTADKSGKDDNFRGLTIGPDGSLYVSKGSGSNGVNTVYKVTNTNSSSPLPGIADASSATITPLPGFPTELASSQPSTLTKPTGILNSPSSNVFTPFGLWFANSTTLYVADEGYGAGIKNATSDTALQPAVLDLNAGLEKWSLANGTWQLDYVLQNGLNLGQAYESTVAKGPNGEVYTAPVATAGLRNITGQVNGDGTVTIYGVTSTASGLADEGADPNKVVAITDTLGATAKSTANTEFFSTVESAGYGQVLRGVSLAPSAGPTSTPTSTASTPIATPIVQASSSQPQVGTGQYKHVLIISIDGLHGTDLSVGNLQSSLTNIKKLQSEGVTYTNASTSAPSDSFPGELNYITGANPGTTGVFYDASYSRTLYASGTTLAQIQSGAVQPGTPVNLFENDDANFTSSGGVGTLNGGQGIDTSQLPVDSNGNVVYPNQYLKVNTIFNVASSAGLGTAWSDKHVGAYSILAGPSSNPSTFNFATGQVGSISDYSSLEINSLVAIDPTRSGPLPDSIGALVDESVIPYNPSYFDANGNFILPFINGAYVDKSSGSVYYSSSYTTANGTVVPFNSAITATNNSFTDPTKGNPTDFLTPPNGFSATDFTSVSQTETYDDYKIQQVLNEINGLNANGTSSVSTPAIFGLDLQAVSVAEKETTVQLLIPGQTVRVLL